MDMTTKTDAETRRAITPEAWAAPASGNEDPIALDRRCLGVVLQDMLVERIRQIEFLKSGRIRFDCANPEVAPARKLRVLVEEVGEVAQAMDDAERAFDSGTQQFIDALRDTRAELVQVATVAAATAASIDRMIEELEAA